MQEISLELYLGMLLLRKEVVLGGKHFYYAGNATWVISGNAITTEGLVLDGNTMLCKKCHLVYNWECSHYGRICPA